MEWTTDHTSMTHRESQAIEYRVGSTISSVRRAPCGRWCTSARYACCQRRWIARLGGRRRSSARRASYERWCSKDNHTHRHTDRDRDRGTHTRHKTQDRDIDADSGTTQEAVGVFCWDNFYISFKMFLSTAPCMSFSVVRDNQERALGTPLHT